MSIFKQHRGFITLGVASSLGFLSFVWVLGLALAVTLCAGVMLGVLSVKLTSGLRELSTGEIDQAESD